MGAVKGRKGCASGRVQLGCRVERMAAEMVTVLDCTACPHAGASHPRPCLAAASAALVLEAPATAADVNRFNKPGICLPIA